MTAKPFVTTITTLLLASVLGLGNVLAAEPTPTTGPQVTLSQHVGVRGQSEPESQAQASCQRMGSPVQEHACGNGALLAQGDVFRRGLDDEAALWRPVAMP